MSTLKSINGLQGKTCSSKPWGAASGVSNTQNLCEEYKLHAEEEATVTECKPGVTSNLQPSKRMSTQAAENSGNFYREMINLWGLKTSRMRGCKATPKPLKGTTEGTHPGKPEKEGTGMHQSGDLGPLSELPISVM